VTSSPRRPRILYVEDDPEIASMTIEGLSEAYELEHERSASGV
jgi:CheY-like chemotaxis protein